MVASIAVPSGWVPTLAAAVDAVRLLVAFTELSGV